MINRPVEVEATDNIEREQLIEEILNEVDTTRRDLLREFLTKDENELTDVSKETVAEAIIETGSVKREKVVVPEGLSLREIQDQFELSKATAWNAQNRGYFFRNYHERVIDIDTEWAHENHDAIEEASKIGAFKALQELQLTANELHPFSLEDVRMCAYIRLFELSGVKGSRESVLWRVVVAKHGAMNFIKDQLFSEKTDNIDDLHDDFEEVLDDSHQLM
jgi:hypothetical protein